MLANLVLFDKPTIIITALALARSHMGQVAGLETQSSRNKQYVFYDLTRLVLICEQQCPQQLDSLADSYLTYFRPSCGQIQGTTERGTNRLTAVCYSAVHELSQINARLVLPILIWNNRKNGNTSIRNLTVGTWPCSPWTKNSLPPQAPQISSGGCLERVRME